MFRHLHRVGSKLSSLDSVIKISRQCVPMVQVQYVGSNMAARLPQEVKNYQFMTSIMNPTLSQVNVIPTDNVYEGRAENNYIYSHVHKRLEKFNNIGNLIGTIKVAPAIRELRDLIACEVEDKERFQDVLKQIKLCIQSMNQQELAILLTAIKNDFGREFGFVRQMVDMELRWLLKKHVRTRLMDLDLWFYISDVFFESRTRSKFVKVLVNYLTNERELEMTNGQFLHLLFLVILERNQSKFLPTCEKRILQILRTASFEDLSIVCLAYFKTKTVIKNVDILKGVIDQTIDLLPTADFKKPGFCSIIKSIRYSRDLLLRDSVEHLINSLVKDVDVKHAFDNPFNAVHTIKLMESFRIYDAKILDLICDSMFMNLHKYRIKDIQYFLTSLSNFAHDNADNITSYLDILCHDIITNARIDSSKQDYHLMPLLRSFLMFNYHNDKLIKYTNEQLKNPSKVKIMREVLEFDRTALLVYVAHRLEGRKIQLFDDHDELIKNISLTIDRKSGNLGSVRQDSSIRYLDFILNNQKEQAHLVINNKFREVATKLSSTEVLKNQAYKFIFQYTLPHQNYTDLIVSKNCIAPGPFSSSTLMPKRVPKGEKHCLLLGIRKFDYIDGNNRLSGYKRLISRLLSQLGYTVINVDLDESDVINIANTIKTILD